MILFICSIFNFIVWGFYYKFDPDPMTWVWFGFGVFWLLVGIVFAIKSSNKE